MRGARGDTDFRWLADVIEMWAFPVPFDEELRFEDIEALQGLIDAVREPVAAGIAQDARISDLLDLMMQHAQGTLGAETFDRLRAVKSRANAWFPRGG